MVVANVVVVAAYTAWWNVSAVDTMLSTYSLVAASVSCCGYATLLMYVLARTMLPAGCRFKLPVAVVIVNSPLTGLIALVLTLAAITLPATLTTVVAKILLPKILPVADRYPVVPTPVGPVKLPSLLKVH